MNFTKTETPTQSESRQFVLLHHPEGFPCTNSLVFYALLEPIMNRTLITKNQTALSASSESFVTPSTELCIDELKCNHGFKPIFSSPTLLLNDEFYLTLHPKHMLKPNAQELVQPSTSNEFENAFLKLYDPNYIEVTSCTRSDSDVTQNNTNESIILYQDKHIDNFSSEISMRSDYGCCSGNSTQEQKSLQDIVIVISGFIKKPASQNQKVKESRYCSCDLDPSLLLRENCKRLKNNIMYGNNSDKLIFDTPEISNNCNRKCVTHNTDYSEGLNNELKTANNKGIDKVIEKCEDVAINECVKLSRDGSFNKGTIKYYDNIFYKKWDKQHSKGLNGRTDYNYHDTQYNKLENSVEWLAEIVFQQKNSCSQVTYNKEKLPNRNILENTVKQSNSATEKFSCLEPKPIDTLRNGVTEVTSQPDTNSNSKMMFLQNGHYVRLQTSKEYNKYSKDQGKFSNGCQCNFSCIFSKAEVKNEESQWDETECQITFKNERVLDEFIMKPTRSAQTIRNTKDRITNTDETYDINCSDLCAIAASRNPETDDFHQHLFKTLVSEQNNKKTIAFSKTLTELPNITRDSTKINEEVPNINQFNTNVSLPAQNFMNIILQSETLVSNNDIEDLCTRILSIPISQSYPLSKSEPSLSCSNFNSFQSQNTNSQKSLSEHALFIPKNKCIKCDLLFVFGNARSQMCYRCGGKSLMITNDHKINYPLSGNNKAVGPVEEKEQTYKQSSTELAGSCMYNPQKPNSTSKVFIRILKNKFMMFDTVMNKIRSKFTRTKCNTIPNNTQNGSKHCKSEKNWKSSHTNLQKNNYSKAKEIDLVGNSYGFNIFDMDKKFNDIKDISITGQIGPSWDDVKKQAKEMRVKNLKRKKTFFSCFRKPSLSTCYSSTLGKYNTLSQNSSTVSKKYEDAIKYKPNLQKEKTCKQLHGKNFDPLILSSGITTRNRSGTLIKEICGNPSSAINKNKAENLILNTGTKTTIRSSSLKKNNVPFIKNRKVKFSTNKGFNYEQQVKNKNSLLDPAIMGVVQNETIRFEPVNDSAVPACKDFLQRENECQDKDDPSNDSTLILDLEKHADLDQTAVLVPKDELECTDNLRLRKKIPKRMKYTNSTDEKSICSCIIQPTYSNVKTDKSFELSEHTQQVSQFINKEKKKTRNQENNCSINHNPKSRPRRDQYSSTDKTEPNLRKRSCIRPSDSESTIDTFLDKLVLGSNINFYSEFSPHEFLQEIKKELDNELSSRYQRGDDKAKEKLSHFIKFIDGKLGSGPQHDSNISDSLLSDLSQERVIRQIIYSGSS